MAWGSTEYLKRFELSKVGVISDRLFHMLFVSYNKCKCVISMAQNY